jgi:hypothetical protein
MQRKIIKSIATTAIILGAIYIFGIIGSVDQGMCYFDSWSHIWGAGRVVMLGLAVHGALWIDKRIKRLYSERVK